MEFKFKNLGFIKEANIEMGNLTIICGENNTGKTYLTYSIYAFYDKLLALDKVEIDIKEKIGIIENTFADKLTQIFFVEEDYFEKTQFNVIYNISKKEKNLFNLPKNYEIGINDIQNIFIITSERSGVSVFYKEIDNNRSSVIELISKEKDKISPNSIQKILDEFVSYYVTPIGQNIKYVRNFEKYSKQKSFLVTENNKELFELWKNIVGGEYKTNNSGYYLEYEQDKTIPLYLSSSNAKSLMLFDLYIKNIAQNNDLLIIDEPELNLNPKNQCLMAKLIVKLINNGVNILMTTHSDYIIKEINNSIMLSNEFKNKKNIMEQYNYTEKDILIPDKVKAYVINTKTRKADKVKVDKYGMDMKMFDDIIYNINKVSDDIYYSLDEND